MDSTEVKLLISLLDDPSQEVYNPVAEKLLNNGLESIPHLEKAWENTLDESLQERIETIIQQIQFKRTTSSIQNWIFTGATDLMEGAYLVSLFQFPELKLNEVEKSIETITKDVWLELNNNLTALEKIKILNHIIFELHGFKGNTSNYYSPQNSFINQVLETKKGNPISLAILYMIVANRLGLSVFGINLPKNFIVAYVDDYRDYQQPIRQEDILFYINPYNKGTVLGKREIDYFLKNQKITPKSQFYLPCSNQDIIVRMISNLILSYEKLGYTDKIERLHSFIRLFDVNG